MTFIRHFGTSSTGANARRNATVKRREYRSPMAAPPAPAPFSWDASGPATCLPDACFCEALQHAAPLQPSNTWSSFAFVFVAATVWVRRRRFADSTTHTLLLIVALLVTGLGSAWYHATLTFASQIADVAGMYFVATAMLARRLSDPRTPAVRMVFLYLLVNAALTIVQAGLPSIRRWVFAALIGVALAVEWRAARRGRPFLLLGTALLTVAFAIWILDWSRVVCSPESLFQGHAAWHVLGALAAMGLVRCYEAEAEA